MTVSTKGVTNRRTVSYHQYDDIVADAEQLAAGNVKTLGNWSFPQILEHLAISLNTSVDGFPFALPGPVRMFARLFLKRMFLNKPMRPGFQIPKAGESTFLPDEFGVSG